MTKLVYISYIRTKPLKGTIHMLNVCFLFQCVWLVLWHHLITVGQQHVEEPQSSQTSILHTEPSQTSLFMSSWSSSRGSTASWWQVGSCRVWTTAASRGGTERVQSLTQSRQVKVQQREEEDGSGTWPQQNHIECFILFWAEKNVYRWIIRYPTTLNAFRHPLYGTNVIHCI